MLPPGGHGRRRQAADAVGGREWRRRSRSPPRNATSRRRRPGRGRSARSPACRPARAAPSASRVRPWPSESEPAGRHPRPARSCTTSPSGRTSPAAPRWAGTSWPGRWATSSRGRGLGPGGSALLGRRLAALAAGGPLLGRGPALLGASALAGGLAAVLGGIRGVGDPGGALLAHALVLEGLVLLLVLHVRGLRRHRRLLRWNGSQACLPSLNRCLTERPDAPAAAPSTPRGRAHQARKNSGPPTGATKVAPTPRPPPPSRSSPRPRSYQATASTTQPAMTSGPASTTAQAQARTPERKDPLAAAAATDPTRTTRIGPLNREPITPSSPPGSPARPGPR